MHLYIFGITFYGSGVENYSFLGVRGNFKVQGFFICHIINYTGYNQK